MSIQAAVVALKTADTPMVAMFGARFYENWIPQNMLAGATYYPLAKYQVISRTNDVAFTPVIVNYKTRIQIDIYVKSVRSGGLITADAARNVVFAAFFGKSGTYGGETIKAVLLDSEDVDLYMADTNAEADHVRMDFMIQFGGA